MRRVIGWLSGVIDGVRSSGAHAAEAGRVGGERVEGDDGELDELLRQGEPRRGPPPALSHHMVRTNGVRLSCTFAGPEDGPLMVLLHGFPEFGGSWRRLLGPLARAGFRVVVPDQRGYGRSDKPPAIADYGIDVLAKDIAGLIRATRRSRAYVVGHDWGAAVAWRLATMHPELVERLVVMNVPHPAVMRSHLLSDFAQLRRSWYMFFFQLPRLPEWSAMRDGGSELYDKMAAQSAPGAFPPQDKRHYMRAWAQPQAMRSMMNWYRAALRQQIGSRELEARVTVPTLILWGKKDIVLDHRMATASLAYCDEGALRYFDEAGHFVHHEATVGVLEELLEFCGPGRSAAG